ncbi:MAG: ribonuclease HI family protein [Bacillota bacterium]
MPEKVQRYYLNIDGASRGNPGPASAAMVVQDESGAVLLTKSKTLGVTTNNVAEWSALEGAVKTLVYFAQRQGKIEAVIRSDSDLVVKQFNGRFKVRDPELQLIAARVRNLLARQPNIDIKVIHIPREQNHLADKAANKALDKMLGSNTLRGKGGIKDSPEKAGCRNRGEGNGSPFTE